MSSSPSPSPSPTTTSAASVGRTWEWNETTVTLTVFYSLFVTHWVVTVGLLVWRRNHQPLKARSFPLLCILLPACFWIFTQAVCRIVFFSNVAYFSCGIFIFTWFVVYAAFWFYFVLKSWRMYNIYQLNRLKVDLSDNADQARVLARIVVLKKRVTTKFIMTTFFVGFSAFVLVWVLVSAIIPNSILPTIGDSLNTCGDVLKPSLYYSVGGQNAFAILCQLLLLWFMRKEKDDFYIMKEMAATTFIWLILIIVILVGLGQSNFFLPVNGWFIPVIYGVISLLWTEMTLCVFLPAIATFFRRSYIGDFEKGSSQAFQQDMIQVVADPELKAMFREFCKLQFCLENMEFFEEVQKFRKNSTKDAARAINNNYINEDGPLSLNLHAETRTEIAARVNGGSMDHDLFDKAENHVLILLRETYIRFRLTAEYKVFQQKMDAKVELMKAAGML